MSMVKQAEDSRPDRKTPKALATQKALLAEATAAFTNNPYATTGLRAICSSHNLIGYHFGSKAKLFNTITGQISEDMGQAIATCMEGIDLTSPQKGLECFFSRILDYAFGHPEGFMIIVQNLGNIDPTEVGLPGVDIMQTLYQALLSSLTQSLPDKGHPEEVKRWCLGVTVLVIHFLGAMESNRVLFFNEPSQHPYRQWVETLLGFVFFPSFNHLVLGDGANEFGDRDIPYPQTDEAMDKPPSQTPSAPDAMTKGDITREKIMKAARVVFAKHPYSAASIRLIGKEGRMDFTLIHHYFPTKDDLFQAITQELFDEFTRHVYIWKEGLGSETLYNGLSIHTQRILDYCFSHPHGISLIIQNMASSEYSLPLMQGFQYFSDFMGEIENVFPTSHLREQVKRWQYAQVFMILNLVGASSYFARLLDMDAHSGEYKTWVRETLLFILYPGFRRLVLMTTPST